MNEQDNSVSETWEELFVIDFIDMNEAENRQKLYERMCANMQTRQSQTQHFAAKQIRVDANHPSTRSSGNGCKYK